MGRGEWMGLKVSEVARLAGVSVRTLHHYDEIGLLRPSGRSQAGYRLYADKDLRKLQQVLFFKELGFPLEEIQRIVNDRAFDLKAGLRMQRELLTEKAVRIKALLQAVDAALESLERGTAMSREELFEVFGEEHRLYISRWFYPCSPDMHRGLGEMYVADSRFTENLDKVKPGLAQYWRDANVANAARKGS